MPPCQGQLSQRAQDLYDGQVQLQGQVNNSASGMDKLHSWAFGMEAYVKALQVQVRSGEPHTDDEPHADDDAQMTSRPDRPLGCEAATTGPPRAFARQVRLGPGQPAAAGQFADQVTGWAGRARRWRLCQRLEVSNCRQRLPDFAKSLYDFLGKDLVRSQRRRSLPRIAAPDVGAFSRDSSSARPRCPW